MRDAVIVSTARTPLTKAARGAFNNTTGATLGAYSIKAAVERAGLEGAEIDDVVMGSAAQQGSTGGNVEAAKNVGKAIAERAQKAGISSVVYDRGGYVYHGRVKALIDATREAGLNKHEEAVKEAEEKSNDDE